MTKGQQIAVVLSATAGIFSGQHFAGNLGSIVGVIVFPITTIIVYLAVAKSLR